MRALRDIFGSVCQWGIKAAVVGPLVLAVPQCSVQNDHDVWDRRAWDSWLSETGKNYKWEYDKVRDGLEYIGRHTLPRP